MCPNIRIAFFAISLVILCIIICIDCVTRTNKAILEQQLPPSSEIEDWNFEEFQKKYDPSTIWEKIDKKRKFDGLKLSDKEQFDIMFKNIDQTDELLRLRIGNGTDGRRMMGWQPPTQPNYEVSRDIFYLRQRIYELMRQAIYQARNKMIIMQKFREKYKTSALYRMGFLTNKIDNMCKLFGTMAIRGLRGCVLSREAAILRWPCSDLLHISAKLVYLWFSIELLSELIRKNDEIGRNILETTSSHVNTTFDKKFLN